MNMQDTTLLGDLSAWGTTWGNRADVLSSNAFCRFSAEAEPEEEVKAVEGAPAGTSSTAAAVPAAPAAPVELKKEK